MKNRRAASWLALVVALVFAVACTRQVTRPPLAGGDYTVSWDDLPTQRLRQGDLLVEGVLLTPAQWPLEGSFKRLLQGDLLGVVDRFDLSFRTSRIQDDVLPKLLAEGFLAAYVRVRNGGVAPRSFLPQSLRVVGAGDISFLSVAAEDLPARFEEIDWERIGMNTLMVVLVIAVVLLAGENRSGRGSVRAPVDLTLRLTAAGGEPRASQRPAPVTASSPGNPLLRGGMLAPGEQREGFLFFHVDRPLVDWSALSLGLP